MATARVAVSKSFMKSYSSLPKRQQKKAREFTEKFQRDPTQSGINFERLNAVRDSKVRSVRIDDEYRAIVIHPPRGDVYLLVWVDHHDEAYAWVRNRVFEVNPTSGVFQVFEQQDGDGDGSGGTVPEPAPAETSYEPAGLFDEVSDEDLLFAGVPQPLLAAVRGLETEHDLDALAQFLPDDASDMLYYMASGHSLIEAIEEMARADKAPAKVDVEDFSTALDRPESRQTFKVVESGNELDEMLDAPLEEWRIFLHPTQRKVVEIKANGPVRVLGGPGTGKTVALMHRTRHLLTHVFTEPDDRVLVTTFTRNLALELSGHLRKLCGDDAKRAEVTNLHSWAAGFMRGEGVEFRLVQPGDRERLMEAALNEVGGDERPLSFLLDEWDQVVQAQGLGTRDDYFTARREGRGARLSRRQRADVWTVFERYRELLDERHRVEWPDVIRETRLYIEKRKIPLPYKAVLADEVQDFSAAELTLLRAMVPPGPNDMFLVGDAHQRIYGNKTRLGRCGIEIRGRSRRLKVNYRTTAQISNHAVALLQDRPVDDLDGGTDDLKGYHSLRTGPEPTVRALPNEAAEAEAILAQLAEWRQTVPDESICVSARTRRLLNDRYRPLLENAGIPTVVIEKDPESEARQPGVRLATMHRMKGLEFPCVLLAAVHDKVVPLERPAISSDDEGLREAHELQERCLLYVAMTRARDHLTITGFGRPSMFLLEGREPTSNE